MRPENSDKAWEYYGSHDPYFGVLTASDFKQRQLTDEAKRRFFSTGVDYVASMTAVMQQYITPAFHPKRALDFGCGVGRLTLPLSRRCDAVVGVDVSESMLRVARDNAAEQGIGNVSFVKGDDRLSQLAGPFDFVHSFIVFQHIPPARGYRLVRRQLSLLSPDGLGALHFTYAYDSAVRRSRRAVIAARERFPIVNAMRNAVTRSERAPAMQMNAYDVNELLRSFQEAGCHDMHLRFSETSVNGHAFYGVTFFFRKRPMDVRAHA